PPTDPMPGRLVFALALLGSLALGLALGLLLRPVTEEANAPRPAPTAQEGAALDSLLADLRRVRARLERLPPPTSAEEDALRYPRTVPYEVHREKGRTLGVPRVTAMAQVDALVAEGRLVPLVDTEFYTVRALEHSAPFVTPDLHRLL